MASTTEKWEQFLDPEVVRPSLFIATMYITAFEILKDLIIEKIRDFYLVGLDEQGPIVSTDYQSKVLSKNKNPLYASLEWLREIEAFSDDDLATFEKLKFTRNQLAHQLFEVVTGQVESGYQAQFTVLIDLLRKLGVWWVVNFEISINPDFDGQEIDMEGIVPGSILSLQLLIEVASGNTEFLKFWREERAKIEKDA